MPSEDRAAGEQPLDRRRNPSAGSARACPLPLLLVDVRTRIVVEANHAVAALVGRLPHELAGKPLEHVDTGRVGEIAEWLLVSLTARDDGPQRRTLRSFDGTEIPVEVRATRVDAAGAPILALYLRDLRSDMEMEARLRGLQAQLLIAQKHETVGRLTAGVAHDFSNLLSVVILTADALRKRLEGDPDAQRELDAIADIGFRARGLTAQLLAFSGGPALEAQPVSLNGILSEMEELLKRSLTENIEVALRLCDGNATVEADPTQIQQVVLNLAVNARDAMLSGGHLFIATDEVEIDEERAQSMGLQQPGSYVLLSVSDTGAGMEEEVRTRIFEPFFSTRAWEHGGGLGLPTVHEIVQRCGGHVGVTSTPGAGTTFRVYLPRVKAAPRTTMGPRGRRVGNLPGGSEHVLVVEDDEVVRRKTSEILEELGYKVTPVGSPDDALLVHDDLWPLSGPHPIDLVLTDVIMPEMSGVELVRRLRVKREDVPAVFMSGYLDPGAGRERPAAGSPYLAKPFTREELAVSVRRVLDGAKGHGATG